MPTDINSNKILGVPGSTNIIHPVSSVNPKLFISVWETKGAPETITLPYEVTGTYTGTIDWGDGNTDVNDGTITTHTYLSKGVYIVTINGTCTGWNFTLLPPGPQRNYIISVIQWGSLRLGSDIGGQFASCRNLDLSTVSDILNLTGITDLGNMFDSCTSLTTINNINSWDTSAITSMSSMFENCILFDQSLSFYTGAVLDMSSMFRLCLSFRGPVLFDTRNVTDMSSMFRDASVFNQPLLFDTSFVTTMFSMFRGATAFDQNIGAWNVANCTNFINFMSTKTPATFSKTNLDAIYNGWSASGVQPSRNISFGGTVTGAKYSAAGIAGRLVLTLAPNNWTILDGGL